jgi:enoyl-[acyl-carrier protein] reductase I
VSAGIVGTKSLEQIDQVWQQQAPLGWNVDDPEPAARAVVALLSDWFPATTGEIVHVDGGVHAIGAAVPPPT